MAHAVDGSSDFLDAAVKGRGPEELLNHPCFQEAQPWSHDDAMDPEAGCAATLAGGNQMRQSPARERLC